MPRVVLVRDPRFPIGGFETWVETLAAKLPERGIDVTLLTPRSDDEVLDELARRAANGEHGVVFTGGYPYLYVAGINLLGSPWVPVPVLHGRDPGAAEWMAIGPPPKIVVPSSDLAAMLEPLLTSRVGRLRMRGRIEVIPHGVVVPPDVPKLAREAELPLRVVVVSRFEDDVKRAFDYVRIVDSCAALPLEFTLVGDGGALPAMRERLRDRVRFTGALPPAQVYEELLNADVALAASSSEAFSLAVTEAFACGCAVVVTDTGSSSNERIREAGGKVVPPGDIDAFVRELAAFTRDPRLVREIGRRGHSMVRERYSADRMADGYAALVRSLPSRPDRKWRPPMYRTPDEALPRTLAARVANWVRAFR
ncbi:MAG TPA: glycosyltransferase family 4 protein [Thermoanaerobaculia bacterium]|jgi:glycosyltransferase involved in cell wall biosynthesis